LDGEIPADQPGIKVREGLLVRRYPTKYLTPRVQTLVRLWRARRRGAAPRAGSVIGWPAPLVYAMDALDLEHAMLGRGE
jgi:hypothetical protein